MTGDLGEQLRTLPPELPDVPDRLAQVHRRARRMRRTRVALVAAATAIVVTVPAVIVSQVSHAHSARPAPASTRYDDTLRACPTTGLTLQAIPGSVQLAHTAAQAEAVVGDVVSGVTPPKTLDVFPAMVRDPIAAKLRLGSAEVPRPMWVIRQLVTVSLPTRQSAGGGGVSAARSPLPGTHVAQLRLVDDATMTPALNALCAPVSATLGDVGFGIRDNSQVGATGVISPAGTGFVLCHASGVMLEGGGTTPSGNDVDPFWSRQICIDQVPLIGDANEMANRSGTTHDVVGVWHHDTLTVTSIGPPRYPRYQSLTTPPCPTPAGGWGKVAPSKTPGLDDTALMRYERTHPGVLTSIADFFPAKLSPVLTLASTDPAATRSALEPHYPRALCVVRSEFSYEQVSGARREMRRAFDAHQLPGVYEFGGQGVTPEGQPTLGMTALTDRPELHAALPDVPDNLLVIDTWIRVIR